MYNVQVYSIYYLKWRHLVNILPVDNAVVTAVNTDVCCIK